MFYKMLLFSSLIGAIAGILGGTYGAFAGFLLLAAYLGSLTALYVDSKEHEEYLSMEMHDLERDFDDLWDEFIILKEHSRKNQDGK
jgi:ABC-type antimicrobial peptide transport system permease subunit